MSGVRADWSRRWQAAALIGLALLSALAAGGYVAASFAQARRDAWSALAGAARRETAAVRRRLKHQRAALASLGREIARVPQLRSGGDYLWIGGLSRQFVAKEPGIRALAVLGPHGSLWWRTPNTPVHIPGVREASAWARAHPQGALRMGHPDGSRGMPVWFTVRASHRIRFLIWALWRADPGWVAAGPAHTVTGLSWSRGPIIAIGSALAGAHAGAHMPIIGRRRAGRFGVSLKSHGGLWIGVYRRIRGYPLTAFALRPRRGLYAPARHAAFAAVLWLFVVWAAAAVLYRARGKPRPVVEPVAEKEPWSEARIRAEGIVQSLADAVLATDPDGRIEYLNRAAEQLTGWIWSAVAGRLLQEVLPFLDEYRGGLLDPRAACLAQGAPVSGEALIFHRDGRGILVEYDAAPRRHANGRVLGVVLSLRDIAEKREMTDRLAHQATHDPLTELPNRILFHERLERALAEARAAKGASVLLFLDMDGFKQVNDTFGHSTGDRVLVLVGERLRRVVRLTDTLARLGGDEFAVVLPALRTGQDALPVVNKIMAALREPLAVALGEVSLSVSIGIAVYPQDGSDSRTLVRAADAAMYEAKAAGKNTYRFFDHGKMSLSPAYPLAPPVDLRQALERGEFSLVYQPQVQAANRQLVAMEALLRWTHPTEGLKYPGEFLAALDEAGLMTEIGEWVLRSACHQNRRWRDEGLGVFPVAVNVSRRQWIHAGLTGFIDAVLSEFALQPDDLVLELSEELLVDTPDQLAGPLRTLKEQGVRLVVQNFGGASSTLGMLRRLRIDALKIEAAFIAGIGDDHNDAVVIAIIALGRALGLKVIASGVETAAQYQFLREAGCEGVQGRYIAAPLDAEAATEYLRAQAATDG